MSNQRISSRSWFRSLAIVWEGLKGFKKDENELSSSGRKQKYQSKKKPARQSRTYILPTLFGLLFGVMTLLQLLIAIGYSNNIIYLMTFSLISMGFTCMVFANENVKKFTAQKVQGQIFYANEINQVLFVGDLSIKKECHSIELSLKNRHRSNRKTEVSHSDLPQYSVEWTPHLRGERNLPFLTIESEFPFGLFRSWKKLQIKEKVIVFPERKGDSAFPSESNPDSLDKNRGLFRDHREFQSADSPKRIDWKAMAKFQVLMVKNFEQENDNLLLFDWKQTGKLDHFEDRLSQLSLWISRAHDEGRPFSLKLPHWTSASQDFVFSMHALAVAERKDFL